MPGFVTTCVPHLWRCITDGELAGPDVAWDDFIHADDDADIAEPCTDESIIRKVQALFDTQECDDEAEESVESPPATASASTVINYITSLRGLVCSRASGNEHMSVVNKLESGMIGSILHKQACITNLF